MKFPVRFRTRSSECGLNFMADTDDDDDGDDDDDDDGDKRREKKNR